MINIAFNLTKKELLEKMITNDNERNELYTTHQATEVIFIRIHKWKQDNS